MICRGVKVCGIEGFGGAGCEGCGWGGVRSGAGGGGSGLRGIRWADFATGARLAEDWLCSFSECNRSLMISASSVVLRRVESSRSGGETKSARSTIYNVLAAL